MKSSIFFRYTPATKALDLKYFHTDPIFLNEAMFVPLSRGIIIKNIVKVIFFILKIFLRLPVSIDLCDESSQSLKSTIQDNLTFLCLLKSQDWHVVFDFASLNSRFKASGSELMRPSPDVLKLLIRRQVSMSLSLQISMLFFRLQLTWQD